MRKKTKITYQLPNDINQQTLPKHIAIIMDGNGRWAKKRGKPRIIGHHAGVDAVREIVRACGEINIECLTLYTFSSENWRRPELEVMGLMKLLSQTLTKEINELDRNNVRLSTIGRMSGLPEEIQNRFQTAIEQLAKNDGLHLILALNYGGRAEIVDAVRIIAKKVKNNEIEPHQIDDETIQRHLYLGNVPDPDLLIRTSGEMRISNYLLWQIAYSELYVTPILWPDFSPECLFDALRDYQSRVRRFGGIDKIEGDEES